ncbi:hypothetical protein CEXT_329561 [Caerostris extrusa]|uniref:Uncharacterized protein n=1 Tax=Caerostris extrusa TaxID=172846 RepID=A0AAV4S5E3_CAEEX|nr:hypothetical protein CEXT_329561 [Caerostris extrusa]
MMMMIICHDTLHFAMTKGDIYISDSMWITKGMLYCTHNLEWSSPFLSKHLASCENTISCPPSFSITKERLPDPLIYQTHSSLKVSPLIYENSETHELEIVAPTRVRFKITVISGLIIDLGNDASITKLV